MAAAHDDHPSSYLTLTNRTDGLRTGSGSRRLEGVSIHSSRHTVAPPSRDNKPPDLGCHILTSSPSFQIRFLPIRDETPMFAGITGHDHILFLSFLTLPLTVKKIMLPLTLRCILVNSSRRGPLCCFMYRVSHSQPFFYPPLFPCVRKSLHNCPWPHRNRLFQNVLPLPGLHAMRDANRAHLAK